MVRVMVVAVVLGATEMACGDGGSGSGDVGDGSECSGACMIAARGGGDVGGGRGGGGGSEGWSPSSIFLEHLLKRENIPSFLKGWLGFLGGGGPFPSYRAQDGPRGQRAVLRPTT